MPDHPESKKRRRAIHLSDKCQLLLPVDVGVVVERIKEKGCYDRMVDAVVAAISIGAPILDQALDGARNIGKQGEQESKRLLKEA